MVEFCLITVSQPTFYLVPSAPSISTMMEIQNLLVENSNEKIIIYGLKCFIFYWKSYRGGYFKKSTTNTSTRALKIRQTIKYSKNNNILSYIDGIDRCMRKRITIY